MVIGLTGAIGSGKSTVSRLFSEAGFAIVDCDAISRGLDAEPKYIRAVREGVLPPFRRAVWQRGFYALVIRSDAALDAARRYVRNNPVKKQERESIYAEKETTQ